MLNRSQIHTLLILRHHGIKHSEDTAYSMFAKLPLDVIREISEFGQDPNSDFATALKHVARGELGEAKTIFDKNPRLVLQSGTAVTRGGLTVIHKTPLECALGEGDPKMVTMIMSYFSQFAGGKKEKEKQIARYKPLIQDMLNQKPYDVTELINIIKGSSAKDVTAALDKNMSHESKLRDALIQFRQAVDPSIVKKPQMHYNYNTLIQALKIYNRESDNLYRASGNNNDKCDLVWRQVIGYLQRSLPAVDRFIFAPNPGSPFNIHDSLNGLGFDYAIIGGHPRTSVQGMHLDDSLPILLSNKKNRLTECIQTKTSPSCVIS